MPLKSIRCVLSIVLLALLGAAPALAQRRATSADVEGVVRDQLGGVLAGAEVIATNVETGASRTVLTDDQGRYAILALPPGTYDVAASYPGFATGRVAGATLALGTLVELNFDLQVARIVGEVVEVRAPAGLDPQRTALSTVVTEGQIDSLPINGRNFIDFAALTPASSLDVTPETGGAAATSGLTFLGQRARSNNITVDGLDNNDIVVGSVRATFSQEAVREFDVLSNAFSAEFGKASGGVVNIVTKSGTNQLGGNLFYYFRDSALNARNYFEKRSPAGDRIDRAKAPFRQQQFGGTLGGPLRRDRAFYFLSIERLATEAANFVNVDDETPVVVFGQPAGTAVSLLRGAGFPIDTGYVGYDVRSTQFLAKLDVQISGRQSLGVRFNVATGLDENIEPWGGLTARSGGAALRNRDVMLASSHTFIPTANLVNELRMQVAYRDQDVWSLDPTCLGLCDRDDEGGPGVEILGVATVGRHRFAPQARENLRIQVLDTLSYAAGPHLFKTGVDFSYVDHQSQSLPLHFGGRYIFAPLPAMPDVLPASLSAVEAFALGLPLAYVQGFGDPHGPFGYSDLSLFAQDDWRVQSNLVLKLGLRYQAQFWPDVTTDIPGFGLYQLENDLNNLAPRLAVAWDPWNTGRTSLHAAYGVYYDNNLTAYAGINEALDGQDGVRTLVLPFPFSIQGWLASDRRLPEAAFGPLPSVVFAVGPGTKTPYAHHVNVGVDSEMAPGVTATASFVSVRGFGQVAVIDFNPILPDLGPFRRPLDLVDPATGQAIPGSSASVLQSTSWGETWYRGLVLSIAKRFNGTYEATASYTLSKAEDNSTDFQSAFLPEQNGRGRNPADSDGLPIGFDPDGERGPSLHDRRHVLVLTGIARLPWDLQLSGIVNVASGRPYNILAGADLNGDGDGGSPPSDRARRNPLEPSTSIGRNAGRMPATASVSVRASRRFAVRPPVELEAILEVFSLFNRTNFTGINNIFGTGAYPSEPLPTFGQFSQAGPPRQVQLALKVVF